MGRKTTVWLFLAKKKVKIAHEKTGIRLRKENLMRENESLLIAAQNNAIKTNYIKAKIDNKQQNIDCRLCGERDET